MSQLTIPDDWSAEQALAVLNFLDACYDAIWDAYEQPVTELLLGDEQHRPTGELQLQLELVPTTADADPDDDIPF